jgi:hypothetical protein
MAVERGVGECEENHAGSYRYPARLVCLENDEKSRATEVYQAWRIGHTLDRSLDREAVRVGAARAADELSAETCV